MRIALMGSAPSSAHLGPFKDASYATFLQGKPAPQYPPSPHIGEDWEIWGCSPGLFGLVMRATRWFELHRWEPGASWFSPEYCQFLREFNGPVYTGGAIPEIKNHVVYPIERVESVFGSWFLTSSLALMMALAILEIEDARANDPGHDQNEDVLGLWGVDMAANEEYQYQRPGCVFFILEALRRNIGVYIPPESDLMCPMPVYGLCEWDHAYIKATARAREMNARLADYQQQMQKIQAQVMGDTGALSDLDYFIKTWLSPYRFPTGMVARLTPGTGFGRNVTHIDGEAVKP